MNTASSAEEIIYNAARQFTDPNRLSAYLDLACGGDPAMRNRIERLLRATPGADEFFNRSAVACRNLPEMTDAAATAVPPLSEASGTVIGRYTLLQRIGEGGFGAVYMAEQKEPVRRRVALKIIKLGMDTQQVVARFEAERQALAMMDHPNIAKILDAGLTECLVTSALCFDAPDQSERADESEPIGKAKSQIANRKSQITAGRPYFVMELVKGQTVTKYCDEHQLSTRQRLELFIPICQAIQHAHQKGIIHRDVKPSNILIATIDGRPVPKVIDFGIAKATQHDLTDKIVFTQFTQFMGTPAYMSPEQAAQDSTDIDTRSDIYSLGVLLYELLTGKTPVEANELSRGGYDEIRRRIREIDPPRPSERLTTLTNEELTTVARSRAIEPAKLTKLIRGELDWIVLKAMEKDRSRRYETASALAQDIQRYLEGEPVTAVKPSPIYRFQKFARRHKTALAAAACFALLLTVSACVSTAQAIKNKSLFTAAEEARLAALGAKERETELRRIAETERDRNQRLLYIANMNLAKRAWDEANIGRAVELLEIHRPQPGQPDLRNFEWFYLDRLCHSELFTLKGHTGVVTSVAFSPDGKRLASASLDRTVKIWNAVSGEETLTLRGHTEPVIGLAFSPDGKQLASASGDMGSNKPGEVKTWDATTGQERFTLKGHTGAVVSVAFSSDGRRLASASWDRTVKIWDAATGEETFTLNGHTDFVYSVAFSPNGSRLASASLDRAVKIWDSTTGQETLTLNGHIGGVASVAYSPDGKKLASSSFDQSVKVWDTETGREILNLPGHSGTVFSVSFSPDGKLVASGGYDRTMRIWNATSGREQRTLKAHNDIISSVSFSPDGKHLASAGFDRTVRVFDLMSDQEAVTLNGRTDWFGKVAFSADGKRLASGGWDKAVKIWECSSDQEMLTLNGHTARVTCVVFDPHGKWCASAGRDQTIKIWDAKSGLEILTWKGHSADVTSVVFSADGKWLASGGTDHSVKVWNTSTGESVGIFNGHTAEIASVVFNPEGTHLASASYDALVKLWDLTTTQETRTLKGHKGQVQCVAFSPDGKRIASGGGDRKVIVWDVTTGKEVLTLKNHGSSVNAVTFSPDGKRLASASSDRTVKIWEMTTGQETLTLNHGSEVMSVAFATDGIRLLSGSGDRTVKIWDARPRSETPTAGANPR